MAKKNKDDIKKTSFQKFEEIEINRDQLKNAPYNPRTLGAEARKKLKKNISEVGLLALPVWNKRTGNIVSGHQRISILDSLEKTHEYTLRVACVDLDEKIEKEQNVFMNNPHAQGDFNLESLENMIADMALNSEKMGFNLTEKIQLVGLDNCNDDELVKSAMALQNFRNAFDKNAKKRKEQESNFFYKIIVFRNDEEKENFEKKYNLPGNKYVSADQILSILEKIIDQNS